MRPQRNSGEEPLVAPGRFGVWTHCLRSGKMQRRERGCGVINDEQWPIARLIPITSASGVEAQERNAASALLSVCAVVSEFGRALLKPLGAPAGQIKAFVEVPFEREGKKWRPDGLISVSRGNKSWVALVETKVGSAALDSTQIDAYLDIARDNGFDAVLSISNHYVTSSSEYPVAFEKRKTRKVQLRHRSWVDVLAEAVVQKEHQGVSDPDQAFILGELIRYLSDPRSGVMTFNNMGGSWSKVKDGARSQTLRRADSEVGDVASRWDDLVRYLCLHMTMDLGREVLQVLSKKEATALSRLNALKESLATTGTLSAELQVPDAGGRISILADLRSRQIISSTSIDAPREGRARGKVSWLLRQVQDAPDETRIEVRLARSQETLAESLGNTRARPELLYPEGGRDIRAFGISLSRNMGLKKDASRGSFIESVVSTTEDFYRVVLQNLRPWKPAPPKLKPKAVEEGADDVPPAVSEAVEEAKEEQAP